MNSSSLRSDSQRPKRPSATARKTMSRSGDPANAKLIAVSTVVRNQVTKTVSKEQLLRTN